MNPASLWLPLKVADLDVAKHFYTVQLGLSEVDAWDRNGERGVVLKVAGPGYVELVQAPPESGPISPASFALELVGKPAVEAASAALAAEAPVHFPRGYFGFTVRDPDGVPVLIWTER